MVLVIGITGGIGSGKSTVTKVFARLGVPICSADQVAKQVVAPNTHALQQIISRFGQDFMTAEGALDRAKLRELVFSDVEARRWLENLTHPLVEQHIKDWIARLDEANTYPYAMLESPLLLEANQQHLVDRVLVVDVNEGQQISRAGKRDKQTHQQIKAIMATQLSRQARLAKADYVIDNTGNLMHLKQQINTLHEQILASL